MGDPSTDQPAPPGIDTSIAHPARIYDYLIGGKDNYAVDRAVGDQVLQVLPMLAQTARRNREFVLRAVRFMVGELGIDQIVDVGTGIPTAPAVHQVAKETNPATRVAYVDNDPIVLVHDRALLERERGVVTFMGDLTDPASIVDNPELAELIDWSRPVGFVCAAVYHFVPDDLRPLDMIAAYRSRMAPGSALALSHITSTGFTDEENRRATEAYRASAELIMRSREEIAEFFAGLRLAAPGVVNVSDWRPDDGPRETDGSDRGFVGVGILD